MHNGNAIICNCRPQAHKMLTEMSSDCLVSLKHSYVWAAYENVGTMDVHQCMEVGVQRSKN